MVITDGFSLSNPSWFMINSIYADIVWSHTDSQSLFQQGEIMPFDKKKEEGESMPKDLGISFVYVIQTPT